MDMTTAITPKSDQINADDLLAGPRTFTIDRVTEGTAEQPANVHLVENPGKPYRPGKSMARVMVKAWGANSDAYAGQRLTLFCDPSIRFGSDAVGGIRIAEMTGIDGPLVVSLTVTRGNKKLFTVQPLADAPPTLTEPTEAEVANSTDRGQLTAWWHVSSDKRKGQIQARVAELDTEAGA
jgi:hypothetical protein